MPSPRLSPPARVSVALLRSRNDQERSAGEHRSHCDPRQPAEMHHYSPLVRFLRFLNTNAVRPGDDCHAHQADEQAMLHHARDLGQPRRQRARLRNASERQVENQVPPIRDKSMALAWCAAKLLGLGSRFPPRRARSRAE